MNPETQPAADTVRLIREGMIHAEQLSRYYLHLAHRFLRLGDASSGSSPSAASHWPALFTISEPSPQMGSAVALIIASTGTISCFIKASMAGSSRRRSISGDLYRQMQQFSSDWSDLYSDA